MADISKIQLPSGNTYEIKDAYARSVLAAGLKFVISWDGSSVPVVANIPYGVQVTYNGTTYTGTKSAETAEPLTFYLVYAKNSVYSEYVAIGETGSKSWEKLGDTSIDLSQLGDLAFLDTVTLSKGSGAQTLGANTTFTNSPSEVSFASHSTVTVVKSYPGTTSKLATTSIPNVSNVTPVALPTFTMGTGTAAETLIIGAEASGSESASKVSLGTAITAATGSLSASGGGDSVMTGLGTAVTDTAIKTLGAGTAAAQTVSVGNNDRIKVAIYDDLSVTVS